jgi:hypothetical protein
MKLPSEFLEAEAFVHQRGFPLGPPQILVSSNWNEEVIEENIQFNYY